MASLVLGMDTEEFANRPLLAHMVPSCKLEEVTPSSRPVVLNQGKFGILEDIWTAR